MSIALGMSIRSKLLGAALRHARLRAGLFPEEAAVVLGCDAARLEEYESGRTGISLPDLILWSEITSVSVSDLLAGDTAPPGRELPSVDPRALLLCRKMLGVLLRQARTDAGKSVEGAAVTAGVPAAQVEAMEAGTGDLSVPVLELLASDYGVRLGDLAGEVMSAGAPPEETSPAEATVFAKLPDDVRNLVSDPSNLKYLRLAGQVSRMPTQVVRELGQSLLDAARE